jgi:predicted transcriptional regulator
MEIQHYVKKDFCSVFTNSPVSDIKSKLDRSECVVVLRADCYSFAGILTKSDILGLKGDLATKDLPHYPKIQHHDTLDTALKLMNAEKKEVLPVFKEEQLVGLVYQRHLFEQMFNELQHYKNRLAKLEAELTSVEKMRTVLRALYKDTQAIRFFVAPDNTIIYYNSNAEKEIISNAGEEMKIGDHMDIFSKRVLNKVDKQYDEYFRRSINGEYILTESLLGTGPDSIWIRTEYNPIRDEGNIIGVSVSITNITDKKRNELLIKKQNEVLRNIIFSQSHNVRGPIATMLGLLNIFDRDSLSQENRKLIDMMEKTVTSLDENVREVVYQIHELRSQDSQGLSKTN